MLKDFRVTDSLGLKDFPVKGIWRLHDLGVKPSSACCELRMLQRDRVQWITAADTPSCGQKKHTRWPATTSKCWCAIMRSEKTHALACNEFYSACNELRMRQRDRVHWITAADTPSCGQKKHTRWPATTSKCWCAIMRSEKTHTLACNEFFGVQMTHGCGSAIGYNEWHNPTSDATAVAKKKKRIPILVYVSMYLSVYLGIYFSSCLSDSLSICLSVDLSIYLSVCLSIYLCIYLSTYLCIYPSIDRSIYRSIYRSLYLSIYLSVCLSIYLCIYLCVYLSPCIDLSIDVSIDVSIYLSVCLSVYLSDHLSICLFIYPSIYISHLHSWPLSLFHLITYLSIYLPTCLSISPFHLSRRERLEERRVEEKE